MYRLNYTHVLEDKKEVKVVGEWVDRGEIFSQAKAIDKSSNVKNIKVEAIIDVTSDFIRD